MNRKGFSLIEIMVSLTVFAFVVAAALTLFFQSNSIKNTTQNITEIQQLGRNTVDFVARDLREAGYGVDLSKVTIGQGQLTIAYGDKYTLIFNANISPNNDDPENPLSPQAFNPAAADNDSIPLSIFGYSPTSFFETGAETYVYTLDVNHDGVVNEDDANYPGTPSAETENPNDYTLVRYVYGYDPASDNNLRRIDYIGIVEGPSSGEPPIFWYWYDDDDDMDTPSVLWGDTNGDGVLTSDEYAALGPIPSSAKNSMDKITLYFVAPSPQKVKGKYLSVPIVTTVALNRNLMRKTYTVKLHAYNDVNGNGLYDGEAGIEGLLISLNTGDLATTDDQGIATFELPTGSYSAIINYPAEWMPTTTTLRKFNVLADPVDLSTDSCFGLKEWDTGEARGRVFMDDNLNGIWDTGEMFVGDIAIQGTDNGEIITDDTGYFSGTVKCYVSRTIYPSLGDTMGLTGATIVPESCFNVIDSIVNSDYSVSFMLDKDGYIYALFGIAPTEGIPCTLNIIKPSAGEGLRQGETYEIQWFADGIDDGMVGAWLFYSSDDGETWQEISYEEAYGDTMWNGYYYWYIDTMYHPSTHALLKIRVTDEGRNVAEKTVNFILSPEHGFTELYFQRDYPESLVYIPRPTSWDSMVGNYGPFYDTLYAKLLSPMLPLDTLCGVAFAKVPDWRGVRWRGPLRFADLVTPAEWITPPYVPNADTIYEGDWTFVLYGAHLDSLRWGSWSESGYYYKFHVRVSKRDSTGDPLTDELIFDTRDTFNIDRVEWKPLITHISNPETIRVNTKRPTSIDPQDRLYIKLYLECVPYGFWSGAGSDTVNVYFYFNPWKEGLNSRVLLPRTEDSD